MTHLFERSREAEHFGRAAGRSIHAPTVFTHSSYTRNVPHFVGTVRTFRHILYRRTGTDPSGSQWACCQVGRFALFAPADCMRDCEQDSESANSFGPAHSGGNGTANGGWP